MGCQLMARRTTRRAQSVVPFGVGSIVEFEDEALMPAGLDAWPEREAERLFDDRLARRLHVQHFCLPPPKPEKGGVPGTMAPLPYVRFPQWHFCPRCRVLRRADLFDPKRPRCRNELASPRLGGKPPCGSRPERSQPTMIPLRFVAVCPAGHIEDFPWSAWAHTPSGQELTSSSGCGEEGLYFYSTRRGGLSGLIVACGVCGKKRSMMGTTSQGGLKGWRCSGNRPWLGKEASEKCDAPPGPDGQSTMLGLQRGASNLYFPEVTSSILIPPYSTKLRQIVSDRRIMDALEAASKDGVVRESVLVAFATLHDVDPDELREAYHAQSDSLADDSTVDEAAFRHAEYLALHQERRDSEDALACRRQDISRYAPIIRDCFASVTLVERLTETRVLTGFSRISPGTTTSSSLSHGRVNWLPGFRVRGEGIFLGIDTERLAEFDRRSGPRLGEMIRRAKAVDRSPLPVTPSLVLLHTLAHVLIKRLSFEAGYGTSSIRERVYATHEDSGYSMGGMLLYTAAGDADGTLGGLVGLGRAGVLERVVAGALADARWCGSDPICIESQGQGPDSLNLAACHACALLPETSCEFQNRILDRQVVLEFFSKDE